MCGGNSLPISLLINLESHKNLSSPLGVIQQSGAISLSVATYYKVQFKNLVISRYLIQLHYFWCQRWKPNNFGHINEQNTRYNFFEFREKKRKCTQIKSLLCVYFGYLNLELILKNLTFTVLLILKSILQK